MTEQLKYVDLNQNDMVMILGALLTIKSALPDDLENQPQLMQEKAAQLLYLIERFREALNVHEEAWERFGQLFGNLANVEKEPKPH